MKTEEINYSHDQKNFIGYVAYPEKDKAPLILIAPSWAGRDEFVKDKAEKLAREGYVAMAVDMYGDAKVGSSTEENQSLMTPLVEDRDKLKGIIKSALEAGRQLEAVEATNLSLIHI